MRKINNVILETLEPRRLLAFGQLAAAFGEDGHVVTPFPNASSAPIVKDLQVAGGKILAGGSAGLARYSADGKLDPTFGTSGRAIVSGITFKAMALDATGRIYVLGNAGSKTVLQRFSADGILDTTYAGSGTATVTPSTSYAAQAIAVQADGKVLIGGVLKDNSQGTTKARIYRLNSDSSADSTWGSSASINVQLGTTNLLTPNLEDNLVGLAVLADGHVLVAGGSKSYAPGGLDPVTGVNIPFSYGTAMFAVARLNTDGTLDSSYGSGGVVRSQFANGVKSVAPSTFAAQPDGTVALATSDAADGRLIIGIFAPAGVLSVNKRAEAGYELQGPLDMTANSDGRFFILGNNPQRAKGLEIAWVNATGAFSNVVYTDDGNPDTNDVARGNVGQIAVADDGDVVVAGQPVEPPLGYALAKYDAGSASAARPDQFLGARGNDMFRDSSGGLHLAYFDAATQSLKYAYRGPSGVWSDPVVVDGAKNAGVYLSIAADRNGRPGISYFDGTNGDFKFAFKQGSAWKTETVESRGSIGLYPSMLFDDSGRPTAIYYDKTHGDLKFAVRNMTTGAWGIEWVQRTGDVGRSGSLAIDPNTNRFVCAYVRSDTKQVIWARHRPGHKWGYATAAATKGGADFLSLAYTKNSKQPTIAFYDAATSDLKLTGFSGTKWTTRTLLSKGKVGLYNNLAYDSSGASIYTYDKTNDRLVLVRDGYQGLSSATIVSKGGKYVSVFSDGTVADMAFFDSVDSVLRVRGAPTTITSNS
jgi:uncharacterized delta-60 repeat protein